MSVGSLLPPPRFVAFDANGCPLKGGHVYTYVPGSTQPRLSYQDKAETIPNSNPIILDAFGSCLLYGDGDYQLTVTDYQGNSVPGYSGQTEGAVGVSRPDFVSSAAYGVVGDGTTDDTVAFMAAVAAAMAENVPVLVTGSAGNVVRFTINEAFNIPLDFSAGGVLKPDTGITLTLNNGLLAPATQIFSGAGLVTVNPAHVVGIIVSWYGARMDGVTDDTEAVQSCFAASTLGGVIMFTGGPSLLSAQIVYTMPSVTASLTILGGAAELSRLTWTNGQGLMINLLGQFNSIHIRDLGFMTSGTAIGDAINITQMATSILNPGNTALSDITNVTIRGSDTYAGTFCWANGVNIIGASNINFDGVDVTGPANMTGIGVRLIGKPMLPPVVFNFTACTFNYTLVGIQYGAYVQGVTLSQVNMTGNTFGIQNSTDALQLDQLSVSGCQFATFNTCIILGSSAPNMSISDSTFSLLATNAIGLQVVSPGLFTIIGNFFEAQNSATVTNGIAMLGPSSAQGLISGNVFFALSTGILLNATTQGINVNGNAYQGCTTNVQNLAGASNFIGTITA